MPDFFDLPRPVRDKIYRLHLVKSDGMMSLEEHNKMLRKSSYCRCKTMPPISRLDKKTEKETAPIYYGENHFDIGDLKQFWIFATSMWPRHLKLVRSLTCAWKGSDWAGTGNYGAYGQVRDNFIRISKMKRLENLNIRVDETSMLADTSISRETRQRPFESKDMTPQQQLAIFRFPGITGLLTITNVKNVDFIKMVNDKGEESGGPIPDGPLLTQILPRLRPKVKPGRKRKGSFPFLDLPPELRNRIYDQLLRIPGPIHPSTDKPTTAPKDEEDVKINETVNYESALSLLAVNKQINDEAVGVFYNANSFVFYYPTQLSAFLFSLGPQRQRLVRDITIHYYNLKCGGIDLTSITLPMLKQLTGLRRLHILMTSRFGETTLRNGWLKTHWRNINNVHIWDANPVDIPGIKILFELRGILDIKIRDIELEKKIMEINSDEVGHSLTEDSKKNILQLGRAYEHFNAALTDAQVGKINQGLFTDPIWHTRDEFPALEEESDSDESEDEEDDEEDGNVDGETEQDWGSDIVVSHPNFKW